jgi:hypothetical protein
VGAACSYSRTTSLVLSAAACWLLFAAMATAAGIARETWLVPQLGELRAHQCGTVVVCLGLRSRYPAVEERHDRGVHPTPSRPSRRDRVTGR